MQAFTRQLGAESGVQLNPLRDNSEIPVADNSDQVFGILMRATRGRIDKPFAVDRGNVLKKLGRGESIRVTSLNEAWIHVVEGLNQGAYQAIVQRLVTTSAKVMWAVYGAVDGLDTTPYTYFVSDIEPEENFMFAVHHLECYNDGIKVRFHAEQKANGGIDQPNDKITLNVYDSADELLYEFYGSLNPESKNDYGVSDYLPDLVSRLTDSVEVTVGNTREISIDSLAYGYNNAGHAKKITSDVLVCFNEGGNGYTTLDYMAARSKLQFTPFNYAYISSGGTQSPALLAQLAQLAFDTNRQLKFDIDGKLNIEAAIAFVEQLNMGASPTAHLMHAFYAPLKSDDPTGINGKLWLGTATFNIARCCLRNAQTNTKGFAPKNYPVAGREHPLQRTGIKQNYTPTDQELNALARAKINPVLFEIYSGGGRYVFRDSLTCALVESSLKKLISVADMSTTVDDMITRVGKDILQLPMEIAIKRMNAFLGSYFEGAQSAGWLVRGEGEPFKYVVKPNAIRPMDRLDCEYFLHYDGCVRQIFVTQTLTR
jgi:hypothetical protein